jgi:hypothetical protein
MSGEEHHPPTHPQPTDGLPSATPRLLQRMRGTDRDGTPAEVMSSITDELTEEPPAFDEQLVTQGLDDLLLALIALRDDGTHGTGLIEDLEELFDVEPSPGTVYPRLHDLDEDGTLTRYDLVQTKQYDVADADAVESRLEAAMHQHLAVGLFLAEALDAV